MLPFTNLQIPLPPIQRLETHSNDGCFNMFWGVTIPVLAHYIVLERVKNRFWTLKYITKCVLQISLQDSSFYNHLKSSPSVSSCSDYKICEDFSCLCVSAACAHILQQPPST